MSRPAAIIRLALLSFAAWTSTLLFYFFDIAIAAASLQRAPASTVSAAVIILIAVELLVAALAVAFVFSRSRRYLAGAVRAVWVALFALLQFGTWAVAALALLLVLNR
ncbi:MAG: hypothetical protein MUC51_09660 [Anaerolineae bacterium]|nr:hypothetical protein [Anaerolineae bacterium]